VADDVVRLRRWREIDVRAQLEAFSDRPSADAPCSFRVNEANRERDR
jgi:hypothetical protein